MEGRGEAGGGCTRAVVSTHTYTHLKRTNRNTKLTFLLGELCERGRLDLVCGLPWAQGNEEDEVTQIQDRMRCVFLCVRADVCVCGSVGESVCVRCVDSYLLEGGTERASVCVGKGALTIWYATMFKRFPSTTQDQRSLLGHRGRGRGRRGGALSSPCMHACHACSPSPVLPPAPTATHFFFFKKRKTSKQTPPITRPLPLRMPGPPAPWTASPSPGAAAPPPRCPAPRQWTTTGRRTPSWSGRGTTSR